MKIVSIFANIPECLFSVQYDDKECDELAYLMQIWNDVEFLRDFFKEYETDLKSGYYDVNTVNEAIRKTIDDANKLEQLLLKTAKSGKHNRSGTLQTIFKPLNNEEYSIPDFQASKLKIPRKKSWLRIYAIRIAPNLFVISGGAIKLNHKMNEKEYLQKELFKLNIVKEYLKENELLDESDFEFLEL